MGRDAPAAHRQDLLSKQFTFLFSLPPSAVSRYQVFGDSQASWGIALFEEQAWNAASAT